MEITPQKYFFELWLAVEDDLVVVHPTPVPAAFLMHSELMIFVAKKIEDKSILLNYQMSWYVPQPLKQSILVLGNLWWVQDLDM